MLLTHISKHPLWRPVHIAARMDMQGFFQDAHISGALPAYVLVMTLWDGIEHIGTDSGRLGWRLFGSKPGTEIGAGPNGIGRDRTEVLTKR